MATLSTNRAHKLTYVSGTNELTASISQLIAVGGPNDTSSLARIEFGDVTTSSVVNGSDLSGNKINFPGGTIINGPITKIKCHDGDWLVYYR